MKTERAVKESLKGLGRNKVRTFLMMLGIIIGITTLTIIVSAILGAKSDVMGKVAKFGLDQISINAGAGKIIGVPQDTPVTTLKLEDANAILSEVKNIKALSPQLNTRALPIKSPNGNTESIIIATAPGWAEVWDTAAAAGEFINEEDVSSIARVAVIGQTAA
jgi:putative ABC transport system permease protein